ncbi:IS66-like element accessory protein TnpA|nr:MULTISPECIES: transposase [Rhizobium]
MTSDTLKGSGPLRVVEVLANGKRRFDPVDKDRLIDTAMKPGVSVARLALTHGVNANLLRNWVKLRRDGQAPGGLPVVAAQEVPAFVPVAAASPIVRHPDMPARPSSAGTRLTASLPNGVRLELEDPDQHTLSLVIDVLGRCNVPAG